MSSSLQFVRSAAAGVTQCIAYAHQAGQPYRLVFAFGNGRRFTVQSDLTEGDEAVGFLVFEERVYHPDPRSLATEIPLKGRIAGVVFYDVEGCDDPSRIRLIAEGGQRLTVSSDEFPHGIAYECGEVRGGLAQYDDAEYRVVAERPKS